MLLLPSFYSDYHWLLPLLIKKAYERTTTEKAFPESTQTGNELLRPTFIFLRKLRLPLRLEAGVWFGFAKGCNFPKYLPAGVLKGLRFVYV